MDFEIDGYELNYKNRMNRSGGCVVIYVDNRMKYKVVENMTVVIEDLLECITVEICMERTKNIIVSCIYRTPGSNIEIFNEWMERMFTKTGQKIMFICGDFNIDLLNPKSIK